MFYFVLGTLVYPGALWTAQGAWGATSVFIIVLGASYAYQFERCVRATRRMCMITTNSDDHSSPMAQLHARMIEGAIKKMRFQQVFLIAVTLPASILFACFAVTVIQLTWIWAMILCGMDVLLFLGLALSNINLCHKKKIRNSKVTGSGDQLKVTGETGGGVLTVTGIESTSAQDRISIRR